MKNRLHFSKTMYAVCMALVGLVLTNRVSAQTPYRPFTDGCQWSVSDDKYASAGDTVINGVTYLKIYKQHSNQNFVFSLSEARYLTAIREDTVNRKVYCIMPAGTIIYRNNNQVGQTEAPQEFLLYDFSLTIGDPVTYYAIYVDNWSYMVNEAIGTCTGSSLIHLSDGTPHKVMTLDVTVNYITPGDIWIEGIGSIRGFNNDFFMNQDFPNKKLLCFTNAEGANYQTGYDHDDNPEDCYNRDYGSSIADSKSENFSLYPNPANNMFTLSFTEKQEGVKRVSIMDMLGKEVMNVENCSGNTVNIANLPAGMYIVRVQSQSSKVYSAKLVKE